MRRRITAALTGAAVVLTLAACSGGSDGLASGSDYSVQGALAELPAAEAGTQLMIQTADLVAATEQAGLERPEALDGDALVEWLGPLTGVPGAEGSVPVFVPMAGLFNVAQLRDHQEFADELGWSVLDAEAFVEQSTPPETFTVVSGDVDNSSLSPDLPEIADGVVTAGEGEDLQADLAAVTNARPTGIPLRLAQHDGLIAAGTSTEAVSSWLSGPDETLADHDELAGVAAVLDDADVVSAVLVSGTSMALTDALGPVSEEQLAAAEADLGPMLPTDPFETVGIGWAADDGEAAMTLAYHFGSDEAAEAALPLLEEQVANGTTLIGQPLSELLTLEESATDGSIAVLTVGVVDGQSPALLLTMLMRKDLPFVHL